MAVCKYGREVLEYVMGNWTPVNEHGSHGTTEHKPASMTTIELVTEYHSTEVATCQWCAWPRAGGALYLISGKGCCAVHVIRAVGEVTALQEAATAVRGPSIQANGTVS